MKRFIQSWDLIRILRMVLAVSFIGYGIDASDYMLIVLGALFGVQALLNVSCCGPRGCGTANKNETTNTYKDQIKEYNPK
ncbi:MAG: hypothetical protein ACRCX4_03240 [Bacteroidales bacterium]